MAQSEALIKVCMGFQFGGFPKIGDPNIVP